MVVDEVWKRIRNSPNKTCWFGIFNENLFENEDMLPLTREYCIARVKARNGGLSWVMKYNFGYDTQDDLPEDLSLSWDRFAAREQDLLRTEHWVDRPIEPRQPEKPANYRLEDREALRNACERWMDDLDRHMVKMGPANNQLKEVHDKAPKLEQMVLEQRLQEDAAICGRVPEDVVME